VLLSFQFSPLSFFWQFAITHLHSKEVVFWAFYAYCFAHTKIIFYPKKKTRFGQMILTFGEATKVQQKAYSNLSVSNN
jgi:hypothetical protein